MPKLDKTWNHAHALHEIWPRLLRTYLDLRNAAQKQQPTQRKEHTLSKSILLKLCNRKHLYYQVVLAHQWQLSVGSPAHSSRLDRVRSEGPFIYLPLYRDFPGTSVNTSNPWFSTFSWERIIVHICWHLGKTYLGNPRLPNFCSRFCQRLNADLWTGSVQTSAFKHR